MCVTTNIYHKTCSRNLKRLYCVDLDKGYWPGINSHTINIPVISDISTYIVYVECMEGTRGLYTIQKQNNTRIICFDRYLHVHVCKLGVYNLNCGFTKRYSCSQLYNSSQSTLSLRSEVPVPNLTSGLVHSLQYFQ